MQEVRHLPSGHDARGDASGARHFRDLPGPPGHFLTGHLPEIGADRLRFLEGCTREYGDLVRLQLGPARTLLVNHPDAIEDVLVRQHRAFHKIPTLRIASRVLGQGLLTSEGERWRRQRKLIQPAFHRQRVTAYAQTMVEETARLADAWHAGETRDVALDLMALTMRIATRTLFGAGVAPGTAQRLAPALREIGDYLNSRMYSLRFLIPDVAPTPGAWRYRRAVRELEVVIAEMIDRAGRAAQRAEAGDPDSASDADADAFLPMLLAAHDEEDGGHLTPAQLRDEVMTLFLAGHDTTALALTWTCYLLSQHPEVEACLHAEVDAVLEGRPATAADVPALRYADLVITEAMRLYPPAWVVGRQAIQPVEVAGVRLPRGTVVLASQWTMHRDPRYYDAPEAFRPERWTDGLAKRLPRFAYFPFGGGPRICIGNAFATMEAVLALVTLAQRVRLRLAPDQVVALETFFTLKPRYGMRMVVQPRAA